MKISILTTILSVMLSITNVFSQDAYQLETPPQSKPIKEWTTAFTALDVDASIKLKLVKIAESEAPYIIYDTKGADPTKFSAIVDKNGVLKIRERADSKRVTITEVEVYFTTLSDISISKADVVVEDVLTAPLLDIIISNDAHFVAEIDNLDTNVTVTGKCIVALKGSSLYHTADISTADYNASGLNTSSTVVESAHNAIVKVDATQRLVAKTSTGGKIFYKSYPEIYRSEITMFGAEISQLK